jgi:hypothetical protein
LLSICYELPIEERVQIAGKVAELILKMEQVIIDRPRILIPCQDIPAGSLEPLAGDTRVFEIRNHNAFEYHEDVEPFVKRFSKQPLCSLLTSILESQLSILATKNKDDEFVEVKQFRFVKLQQIAKQMDDAGLFRVNDNEYSVMNYFPKYHGTTPCL